jgi:transposase
MAALAASGAGDRAVQMIDSTMIPLPGSACRQAREGGRQHGRRGRKRGSHLNALSLFRGGVSTKIHAPPDGKWSAAGLAPDARPDRRHRRRAGAARASFSPTKDAGADDLRAELYLRGARPIIPWKSNREAPDSLDRRRYARRNCIERMMALLKQFRRVATRFDKTAESFLSFVRLAAIHRWMRFVHTG